MLIVYILILPVRSEPPDRLSTSNLTVSREDAGVEGVHT